jgi:hypothetical protein
MQARGARLELQSQGFAPRFVTRARHTLIFGVDDLEALNH